MEQEVFMNSANMDKSFLVNANSMSNIQSNPFLGSENDHAKAHLTANQHLLWSHDSLLLDKQMNPLMKSNGSDELQDMEGFEKYMMSNTIDSLERKEQQVDDRDTVKQEMGKSNSISDNHAVVGNIEIQSELFNKSSNESQGDQRGKTKWEPMTFILQCQQDLKQKQTKN